jgi:hypothetical protein
MSSYSFSSDAERQLQKELDAAGGGYMSFTNTDIFGTSSGGLFGSSGDTFGSEWVLNSTVPTTTTSEQGYFGNLTDRIFGFSEDLLSGWMGLKSQELLLDEQTKLILAQQQQQNLLGTVEQPTVTNTRTLQPWELELLSGGGGGSGSGGLSNNTLLIAAAVLAALVLIK